MDKEIDHFHNLARNSFSNSQEISQITKLRQNYGVEEYLTKEINYQKRFQNPLQERKPSFT